MTDLQLTAPDGVVLDHTPADKLEEAVVALGSQ
jgi:hypothetical protein